MCFSCSFLLGFVECSKWSFFLVWFIWLHNTMAHVSYKYINRICFHFPWLTFIHQHFQPFKYLYISKPTHDFYCASYSPFATWHVNLYTSAVIVHLAGLYCSTDIDWYVEKGIWLGICRYLWRSPCAKNECNSWPKVEPLPDNAVN